MTKEKGWTVKHDKYGTWFISRDAVRKDYKRYLEQFNDVIPDSFAGADIDTWFNEQIGWCEVHAYGKQLERPDMQAWENIFYKQMKSDTDSPEDEPYPEDLMKYSRNIESK